MIITKYVAVLEDKNGLPIASLVGDLDFVLGSFCNSLKEDNLKHFPEELKQLVLNGSVHISTVYVQYVHDNKVDLNFCSKTPVNVSFYNNSLSLYLEDKKKFSRDYKREFKALSIAEAESVDVVNVYVKKLESEVQDGGNEN